MPVDVGKKVSELSEGQKGGEVPTLSGMSLRIFEKHKHDIADEASEPSESERRCDGHSIGSCEDLPRHFVKNIKIVGVHKREKPAICRLYVILVKWCDGCTVTIYRRYKEIKHLQHLIQKLSKTDSEIREGFQYLRKLFGRVQGCTQLLRGTMARLKLVDFINVYFDAMTYHSPIAQSDAVVNFCKPTTSDLNSVTWSSDGKTYFYVCRQIISHSNAAMTTDDDDCHKHTHQERLRELSFDSTTSEDVESSDITPPLDTSEHIALCDYEGDEETKKSILKIKKGDRLEVLVKDESGWWLAQKVPENITNLTVVANKDSKYGYVPATYLQDANEAEAERIAAASANKESLEVDQEEDASNYEKNFEETYLPETEMDSSEGIHFHATPEFPSDRFGARFCQQNNFDRLMANRQRKTYFQGRCAAILEMESQSRERSSSLDAATIKAQCNTLRRLSLISNRGSTNSLPERKGYFKSSLSYVNSTNSIQRSCSISSGSTGSTASSDFPAHLKNIQCISTRQYVAQRPDELSFPADSVIVVLKKNPDGWWYGRYNGKDGYVPGVYLKHYNDPLRRLSLEVTNLM